MQNLLAQHCVLVCDLQQFPECISALPLMQTPQSIVRRQTWRRMLSRSVLPCQLQASAGMIRILKDWS